MARNEHDIVRDHFGVLEEDQIASGTATAGYAPIASGTGTAAWGPVAAEGGGYLLEPVFAATTVNITISTALNPGDTFQGFSLIAGQRILVKNQSSASQNGIYIVDASPFRSDDWSTTSDPYGKIISVFALDNHETLWLCQAADGDVIGTDDIAFDMIPDATVKVSSDDTTPGYLNGKLVAGDNITLTEGSGGANETLTIDATTVTSAPIAWQGTWSAGTYDEGDGVTHLGSSYVALTTTTDEPPSADWQLIAEAGAGAGGSSNQIIAIIPGFTGSVTGQAPTASAAFAYPITLSSNMELRSFAAHMTSSASGTYQWGLFDYSSNPAACTKLAGGSGSLNGTGRQVIAASGAPISVAAGSYMLIFLVPAANNGAMSRFSGAPAPGGKNQASYAWDDTPDLTTGWSTITLIFAVWLVGDLDGSGTQW